MNAAAVVAGMIGLEGGLWRIAAGAARRRGLEIGTLPRVVLAATPIAGAVLVSNDPPGAAALSTLAVGAVCDARCGSIFDPITATGLCVTWCAAIAAGTASVSLGGSAVAAGLLGIIWLVTRGRGIGLGDVKLAAVIGAGLGPAAGAASLGAAFVLGATAASVLLALRRVRAGTAIRFGPYLAAGTLMVLAYDRFNAGVTR